MARYEIVDATPAHMSAISGRLRQEEMDEIEAARQVPRHLLYRLWKNSHYRRAVFVDGDIAAVWGCAGMLLSSVGQVWLFTAPPIEKIPLAFAREGRREMGAMMENKQKLMSSCLATCARSVRLWSMLGFRVEPTGAWNRLVLERV